MAWQTDPPPIGVALEFVTDDGKELTGEVSFVASHVTALGNRRNQYMLRGGSRAIIEVARWRRVA